MTRIAFLAAVAAAGCTSSTPERDGSADERVPPPWLDGVYADANVQFRYPGIWTRGSSATFGALVSDKVSPHPAFVSVRYFTAATPLRDPAEFVARTIRPPAGRGLTLLYTQSAFVGGRRAREVAFIWSTRNDTPLGPTMRTFVVPLRGGRTALVVLAAERPRLHGGAFRWVRETLQWTSGLRTPFRRPSGRVPSEY